MRSILKLLALASLLLAGSARPAFGEVHFYGAPLVAVPIQQTSTLSGHAGWGATLGLERPVARAADFLLEGNYYRVPASKDYLAYAFNAAANPFGAFNFSGPAMQAGTLTTGLRLHGSSKRAQTYADALMGLGLIHSPRNLQYGLNSFIPEPPGVHTVTNLALGVGGGVKLLAFGQAAVFADVHFVSFLSGADTPLVPIRLGVVSR